MKSKPIKRRHVTFNFINLQGDPENPFPSLREMEIILLPSDAQCTITLCESQAVFTDYNNPPPLKSTLIICRAKMSEAIRNSQTHNISPSPRFPLTLRNNRQQACKLLSCNCSKSNNYNLSERINFPISHKDV